MACSYPHTDGCTPGQYKNYLTDECLPCNNPNPAPANPVGSAAETPKNKPTAQDWASWITAGGAVLTGAAALTAAIKGNNGGNAPSTYNDAYTPSANTPTETPSGMSTGVKVALVVGGLLLVGGLFYLYRSRSNA